jgi:hypothetical protein
MPNFRSKYFFPLLRDYVSFSPTNICQFLSPLLEPFPCYGILTSDFILAGKKHVEWKFRARRGSLFTVWRSLRSRSTIYWWHCSFVNGHQDMKEEENVPRPATTLTRLYTFSFFLLCWRYQLIQACIIQVLPTTEKKEKLSSTWTGHPLTTTFWSLSIGLSLLIGRRFGDWIMSPPSGGTYSVGA